MANHLNLRYTLLELDVQGNLTIFSNGRSARLLASEVQQLVGWLTMSKDEQPSQLRTTRNQFKLIDGTLIVNEMIRIIPMEVRQIGNWMRKWPREDSGWLVERA
jgi:hypothetical protein